MIKVFIGYDQAEAVAFHTLCHSIWKRASVPVQIIPVMLSQLDHVLTRNRHPLQSNDFAFSRFLVPYLCGFEGRAVFMDCDMLVLDDILNLFACADENYAVQVVKHNHKPNHRVKYLDTIQTTYPKKNWSSVMLFNNPECTALTPEYVNTATGLELHQFKWLEGDWRIGDLPLEWNFLVDYYPHRPSETLSLLHYTEGGPYFSDYVDCDFADEWFKERADMLHCERSSSDLVSEG